MKSSIDERWMSKALGLARRAVGLTRPNPPVGAVIVRNGKLVALGWHRMAGGAHAEAAALARAGKRARGGTLYVTLEPCCTFGRTPPCTDAVIASGISRVVAAIQDPNPRHSGRGIAVLRRAGVKVDLGILREEAEILIRPFSKWIRTGMPYVTLKLGMSADGRISDYRGNSRWITSAESRHMVSSMREQTDAVMVGAGTVLADDPTLLPRSGRRFPLRIVVDSRGRIPANARILTDGNAERTVIATTRLCPQKMRNSYARSGARVLILPVDGGWVSLKTLMRRLGGMGLLHVLCEGGGMLAGSLVRKGLADECILFQAPLFLGGRDATPSIDGRGWMLKNCPRLVFEDCRLIGPDVMIRASVAGRG